MSGGRGVNFPAFPPTVTPIGNYKTLQTDVLKVGNIIGNFSAWKDPVRVTTTVDIILSGEQTVDGIALVVNDRILVKNQTNAINNGIYTVNTNDWNRTDDMPDGSDASSSVIFVKEGITQADTQFVCTNDEGSGIVGTDSLTFSPIGVTPGGVNTNIQFNSNGSFQGDVNLTWISGTSKMNATNIHTSDIITLGDSEEFSMLHNSTNAIFTCVVGDYISVNENTIGSNIQRLGTDTDATDFQVQNSSSASLLTVDGSGLVTVTDRITGLITPVENTDAVNKEYVDLGSWKNKVKVGTIINGTLATDFENNDIVDGITLVTEDRILLKNQTSATENGIYTVNATGLPTRIVELDTGSDASAVVVAVNQGNTNANKIFINTDAEGSAVVGTNTLEFSQITVGGQWNTYTPIITATNINPVLATVHVKFASYMIMDKSLSITWKYYSATSVGASTGLGSYLFNLPPGVTVDSSLVMIGSDLTNGLDYSTVGNGTVMQNGGASVISSAVNVLVADTTHVMLKIIFTSIPVFGVVGSSIYSLDILNENILFTAVIPIL